MTALTPEQRQRLEQLVVTARGRLAEDLATVVSGHFGIDADGTIASESELRLPPAELVARREIVAVIDHLRSTGDSPADAVARTVRTAVFTQLNRLLAIRIAEALKLYPQALANGTASHGFIDLRDLVPALSDDDTGGYATYLGLCGDELAADAPVLFDPRNPLLALAPSPTALHDIVTLLADPVDGDLWSCDDTLGWAYQFFNLKSERDAMRAESAAPSNSLELAVRNQFFTPGYVVDYLVQNTLGRWLVARDPTGQLAARLPLLVDPPAYSGTTWDLRQAFVLDPAAGSCHLLLGAYDVLEQAWQLAGVEPAEAAPLILDCLWGIDIDPRAAQVGTAALTLRARRSAGTAALPTPHVVTARGLPALTATLLSALDVTTDQIDELRALADGLHDAPILGSLLQAERLLDDRVRRAGLPTRPDDAQETLAAYAADDALADDEHAILDALAALADATTSTAAERLFAADATDALRFLRTLRNRYVAVLMNPPFGDPVPETRDYLRTAYPWTPSRIDLLALFVGRGLDLCRADGYLGAITNRAGLFTSGFQTWREQVILGNRLVTLADLGFGVMEQAMVEAAAYVVEHQRRMPGDEATFIRLLRDPDKGSALASAVARHRDNVPDQRVYRLPLATFDTIPGSVLAYAASPAVLSMFTDLSRLGASADVKQGLATADDARFVRAFWEVDPRRIAQSRDETRAGRRWVPFAKGGEYGPYWSDIHLVVDYQDDGQRLRDFDRAYVRNPGFYFRPGLTWPARTNSALSMRILPGGCVFGHKGPSLFTDDPRPYLAWLNSRFCRLLIDLTAASGEETERGGVPSRSYEVGTVRALPDPTRLSESLQQTLASAADVAALALARLDEYDETTRRFVAPAVVHHSPGTLRQRIARAYRDRLQQSMTAVAAHDDIDRALSTALDPDGDAEAQLEAADGPLRTALPMRDGDPTLLLKPVRAAVDAATETRGIARWIGLQHHIADRTLELAAVARDTHPQALLDALDTDALPHGEPLASAEELLSYLVGAAFGRWDVRIGADPTAAPPRPDLYEAVPVCSPAMLTGADGLPANAAPDNYPLTLPPHGLLLDEPGNQWDVIAAVTAAARALGPDGLDLLDEVTAVLGDLRPFLRRRFFRGHKTRYTKSRRTAPLYWPLTVPSRAWTAWVYAPNLTRETLYAVAGAATARHTQASSEIARLVRERDSGGAGRSLQEVMAALAAEEQLAEELRGFRERIDHIADLGWAPDLDDGANLTAAPLADLLPDWPDVAGVRQDLRVGKHAWSAVHHFKDAL